MEDYDYERFRVNLNAALASLEYLEISEDAIEINDSLRCTAGGYGDVYRATLKGPSASATRLVAVKELRAVGDDVTRIRIAIRLARELRIWARLKHPNVLELVGYHLSPQTTTARFISPFMTNGNIEQYLDDTCSSATDPLRTKLLTDVLNGLVYLHSSTPPICHADIKPGNVLINDRVEAVLCDFGLARLVDEQPSGLTTTKTAKGSIRYMSPELLEEDSRHTLYSDIWAYGCLVLKVMTGSLPYSRRRSDHQVLLALAQKQPPASPPDLELPDEMLKMLMTRCWDINPAERPPASTCLSYLIKSIPDELQPPEVGTARTASEITVVPSWIDVSSALSLQPQASPRVSPQSLEYDTSNPNTTSLPPPPPPKETHPGDFGLSKLQAFFSGSSVPYDTSNPITTSLPPPLPPKETDPMDLGPNILWPGLVRPSGPADRSAQSSRTKANGFSSADTQRDGRPRTAEDRSDMVQSFKVNLDDPCSKVLPAALKKYRITDDWRMYALFICYGTTERCLSLDEKALLLFKKLKDAGKNPVFMLRRVRDIRAPISVARGKLAEKQGTAGNGPGHTDAVILWTGVSYAIAIYPYEADYDDEYDVTVGAMFVVRRRYKGWWEVQRDPTGSGTVDERARRCWVPAGCICLLETSMPPATAISEALTVASAQPPSPSPQNPASSVGGKHVSDAPILTSSIVSTSYPGVALMDWQRQGDHESDLVKDDLLRVFKRYNHWSYVVMESGRRGWVPSWLIGKASSGSANSPTQSTEL